ncbi:MAG: response regulator transcription factor [Lachnospiraceae bacterium]|nr:response regulator transcription factor [Lachnospiraceae bacterium]MCD8325235.1 response regulator transcription factor [Lachnospiraceae bacterium]
MARILIVEDEKPINQLMKQNLVLQNHQVLQAFDGKQALEILDSRADLDLVILDIMLPYMSGLDIIKEIHDVPVMFVTARDGIQDKLKGLTSGAEDYLVKPFDMLELIARVNLILKRYKKDATTFELAGVTVDLVSQRVTKDGEEVTLTPQEWSLLEVLIRNANIALSRDRLLNMAWGYDFEGDARTVDVHIVKLRKKLGWENQIKTLYKLGYRLETTV